ncbi:MAG: helix-turn-helix domain-containing protein [Bacteroidaceae bacterium]|nr:helix-turn-helix domain-containing protein [Bacteroidaceae bacterium]
MILRYIDDFGSITSLQAYADLGITQLGARIKELKELGYSFKTVPQKGVNRYGKPTHWVKYYLDNGVC